jgi:hypothetical protein
MTAMSKPRSKAEWVEICEALKRSGEPTREFARKRGLRAKTLEWWRWKLGSTQSIEQAPSDFVEVVNDRKEVGAVSVVRVGAVSIEFSDGIPSASWVAELATKC